MGEWINKMTKVLKSKVDEINDSVMVSIEFENHIVNGYGKFTEWDGWLEHIICLWSEVTSVEPANTDADFMARAKKAVKDAARDENGHRHCCPWWSELPRNEHGWKINA